MLQDYEEGNKLKFAQDLAHEMLHLNGFYSYQISSEENADINLEKPQSGSELNLNIRRSGFSIGTLDGKEIYFNDIDESIIEELAIRFGREYFGEWPELAQEIKDRDEYVAWIAEEDGVDIERVRDTIGSVKKEELPDSIRFRWTSYGYNSARIKFNDLINDLYAKNRSRFRSREAVFTLFARATLTGRILPVARLVERTYGKGSFRELGKKTTKVFSKEKNEKSN